MEISIIVPVFNKNKYISEMLESVKNQTFKDFECILIDDGSNDGSEHICDEYAKSDNRFIVIHQENGGVSKARNQGLDLAKGRFVTFIDSDDMVHKNYLMHLYNSACATSADVVIGAYRSITEKGELISDHIYPFANRIYSMDEIKNDFAFLQKKYGVFGWCWGKLILRELVGDYRFNEKIKLAEDFEFYLSIYPQIKTLYFITDPFYIYREMADNSTCFVEDKKIDYLTQFMINLKYRRFLQEMECYEGENKIIIDESLSNYAYFTLFYSEIGQVHYKFAYLYQAYQEHDLLLVGVKHFQRILLVLLTHRKEKLIKVILVVYRLVRRIIKKY